VLVASWRWSNRGAVGLTRLANGAASREAHAPSGWPFVPWPGPWRWPLLRVVRSPPRQDEAASPTGGKRAIWPVARALVGAQSVPMPAPVSHGAEDGVGIRRWLTVFARVVLGWPRPSRTARLLVMARPCEASGSRVRSSGAVNSRRRLTRTRAPGWRTRLWWTRRTWAVC
jgi:hypothetical protein